ncbi:hypothetical protein C8R45DRAFT_1211366 [Mycena sanguinolenta]|nr:hypothetical protein C8R45DRAFT_1211366 [Mycena sanguinolenta]
MTSALHSSFCIHRSLTATAHNHALYSSHSPGPILASFGDVIRKNSPPGIPQRMWAIHIHLSMRIYPRLLSHSQVASINSLVLAGAVLSTPPCWPSSTRLRDTRQALDALVLRLNGLKGGYMHVFWVDKATSSIPRVKTSRRVKSRRITLKPSVTRAQDISDAQASPSIPASSVCLALAAIDINFLQGLFSPVTDSHPFKSLLYTIVLLLSGLQRLTPPPICLTIVFSYQSWTRPSNAGSRISNLYLRRSRLSMEILLRVGSRPFVVSLGIRVRLFATDNIHF